MTFEPPKPEPGSFAAKWAEACLKLVQKHQVYIDGLTERQVAEALKQAVECGDFQIHVVVDPGPKAALTHRQGVSYIPGRRVAELEAEVAELREELARLTAVLNNLTNHGTLT